MELDSEGLHDKQIECICNEPHLAYFKSSPRGLSTPWTRLSETGMPPGWWTDWSATISFHILLCKSGVWIFWCPLPCHQCTGTPILQPSVLLCTPLNVITVNTARSYTPECYYIDKFRQWNYRCLWMANTKNIKWPLHVTRFVFVCFFVCFHFIYVFIPLKRCPKFQELLEVAAENCGMIINYQLRKGSLFAVYTTEFYFFQV